MPGLGVSLAKHRLGGDGRAGPWGKFLRSTASALCRVHFPDGLDIPASLEKFVLGQMAKPWGNKKPPVTSRGRVVASGRQPVLASCGRDYARNPPDGQRKKRYLFWRVESKNGLDTSCRLSLPVSLSSKLMPLNSPQGMGHKAML